MKLFRALAITLSVIPVLCFGQKKEVVELQRDVALLQDQVRSLQRTMDEKLATLTVLIQQTLDNVNKANTSVAVLESGVRDRLKEQEKSLAGPVATVGVKLDQMSDEFRFVRESTSDLNSRLGKLQAQVTDLSNAIKIMQAPPPPPGSDSSSGGLPAGMSAETLYQNAMRDKLAGSYDLSLQQFNDYLKFFGTTSLAPNAQYYIGELYYQKEEWDQASQSFDLVLEKYPENPKTPDALFMKGRTLLKMKQRTAAAQEFRAFLKQYPNHDLAPKAKVELKGLGFSTSAPKRK